MAQLTSLDDIPKDIRPDNICHFCGNDCKTGSYWCGWGGYLIVCADCLESGHAIGALLGDGILDIIESETPRKYGKERKDTLDDIMSATEKGIYRAIAIKRSRDAGV